MLSPFVWICIGRVAASQPTAKDLLMRRPLPITSNGTLYILIGDSLDRHVVEHQCSKHGSQAVEFNSACSSGKQTCLYCASDDVGDGWLNIHMFGFGLNGCYHTETGRPQHAQDRLSYLEEALAAGSSVSSGYRSVVLQLHSGLWDLYAMQPQVCMGTSRMVEEGSYPAAWMHNARSFLATVHKVVAGSSLGPHVRRHFLWRTIPFMCRSFANSNTQGTSAIASALSGLGARLACDKGLILADWRAAACLYLNQSSMRTDNLHFASQGSAIFAEVTRQAAAWDDHDQYGARQCRHATLEMQCELDVCDHIQRVPYTLPSETPASRAAFRVAAMGTDLLLLET